MTWIICEGLVMGTGGWGSSYWDCKLHPRNFLTHSNIHLAGSSGLIWFRIRKCQIQQNLLQSIWLGVSHIDAERFTIIANNMMNEGLMLATKTKEGLIPAITQTQIVNNSKCCHGLKTHCYTSYSTKWKQKEHSFLCRVKKMFKIKNILQNNVKWRAEYRQE